MIPPTPPASTVPVYTTTVTRYTHQHQFINITRDCLLLLALRRPKTPLSPPPPWRHTAHSNTTSLYLHCRRSEALPVASSSRTLQNHHQVSSYTHYHEHRHQHHLHHTTWRSEQHQVHILILQAIKAIVSCSWGPTKQLCPVAYHVGNGNCMPPGQWLTPSWSWVLGCCATLHLRCFCFTQFTSVRILMLLLHINRETCIESMASCFRNGTVRCIISCKVLHCVTALIASPTILPHHNFVSWLLMKF